MPRIRTVKPEFFRSPDTAKVSFPARIFYQALWCWADDFGIGETNLNGLLGFAFCDEDGFTAQDLRQFCAEVAQHYGVVFYTVRGRHYYAVPSWERHQKLEKRPDRRKHPGPSDPDAVPDQRVSIGAESALNTWRESGADAGESGAGTGEQGNRGTGEEKSCSPAAPTNDYPAAFLAWWQHYPRKTDKRKALGAWKRALKRAGNDELIAGAISYARDPNRDPSFTKQGERWLNGDCWLDDPLPARRDGKQNSDDRVREFLDMADDDFPDEPPPETDR